MLVHGMLNVFIQKSAMNKAKSVNSNLIDSRILIIGVIILLLIYFNVYSGCGLNRRLFSILILCRFHGNHEGYRGFGIPIN